MVCSAEDVTRGNGLSSYISPIKRLMIQYYLMTVTLPDTPIDVSLKDCLQILRLRSKRIILRMESYSIIMRLVILVDI